MKRVFMGGGITEEEKLAWRSDFNENLAFRPPYYLRGIYDAITEAIDKTLIEHFEELGDPKYWVDDNVGEGW